MAGANCPLRLCDQGVTVVVTVVVVTVVVVVVVGMMMTIVFGGECRGDDDSCDSHACCR
jgi:hypothetical protein